MKDTYSRTDPERAKRLSPHRILAVVGIAIIVFMAPFEPNLALRFGPVVAVFGFVVSGPLGFRIGWTEWALALFALWVGASGLWTTVPDAYQINLLTVLSIAVIFIGIRAVTDGGVGVRTLIAAYVAGTGVGLVRTSADFATPEATRDVLNRVTQVGDLNVNYVAYSAVAAVLMLVLLLNSRAIAKRRGKFVTVIAILALTAGVVATQTRGALIAVVLLVLWWLISRWGLPLRTVVVGSIVVAVSICVGWSDQALNLLNFGERAVFGLSGRTALWEQAREVWSEHVFEGAGFGAVRAVTQYNLPAHNTILEIGATLGFIGLALFLVTVIGALTDRLGGMSVQQRRFRMGALVVTFLPVILSSTWELTAAAWVALALLSQPASSTDQRMMPPITVPEKATVRQRG